MPFPFSEVSFLGTRRSEKKRKLVQGMDGHAAPGYQPNPAFLAGDATSGGSGQSTSFAPSKRKAVS